MTLIIKMTTETEKNTIKRGRGRPPSGRNYFHNNKITCEDCGRKYNLGNKVRHLNTSIHKRKGELKSKYYAEKKE
jgi:hypothetical protein